MKRTQLTTSSNLTREEVDLLIEEAERLRGKQSNDLEGKICATLFFEPSTRTRLSFESAILRLNGKWINVTDPGTSSLKKGETLEDTIRMADKFADAIIMRHPETGAAERAAKITQKPFINAGDGSNQHPTQALLDIYTIKREAGSVNGKNIAFVGDLKHGRTVHSLLYLLALYHPSKIIFISPKSLKIPSHYTQMLDEKGIHYEEREEFDEWISEMDVLYMTRIQKERFESAEEYEKLKGYYVLTPNMVKQGRDTLRVLHPLPRIDEIEKEVDDLPQAAYFRQVENGLYMRMALLKELIGNN